MERATPDEATEAPPSGGRWSPLRRAAVGLAAAAVLGVLCLALLLDAKRRRENEERIAAAKADIERQLAAIRAKGEPTTFAELAPPAIPDEENAAVIFQDAFAALAEPYNADLADPGRGDWIDDLGGDEPFENRRAKVEGAMARYAEPMRLAREAMRRPRCRFDLDYAAGTMMKMPHLAPLRHLARLFAGEALLHAHLGNSAEAAASLGCIFGLAHAFDGEPVLISHLVRIAIAAIGLNTLAKMERETPLDEAGRRRVLECLETLDFFRHITLALSGERVFVHDGLSLILSGRRLPDGLMDEEEVQAIRRNMPSSSEDHARVLRIMTKFIQASKLPPWKAILRSAMVEAELESLAPHEALTSRTLIPAMHATVIRAARETAHRDAAILGLSCELYKSRHGRYPERLERLAPEFVEEIPTDPFTGKPFHYELRDEGRAYIVYSIGDDLKDDGGVKHWPEKGDIAWEGRAPRARPAAPQGPPPAESRKE